jgi:L-fuculose-phosphate aldolase
MTNNEYPSVDQAKQQLVKAAETLFRASVMSHSGHGNLSVLIGPETMLMTSGGNIYNLDPNTLAQVGLDEQVISGPMEPGNAEIISMHARLYKVRPELRAIIHTHSPAPTAFAYAHEPLPIRSEPMLRFGQAVEVPVVPWAPRGSDESVSGIIDIAKANPETNAVLLANHGLLAFGQNPVAVAGLVIALEEAAEAELAARALGGAKDFPPDALAKVRASMARVLR